MILKSLYQKSKVFLDENINVQIIYRYKLKEEDCTMHFEKILRERDF